MLGLKSGASGYPGCHHKLEAGGASQIPEVILLLRFLFLEGGKCTAA